MWDMPSPLIVSGVTPPPATKLSVPRPINGHLGVLWALTLNRLQCQMWLCDVTLRADFKSVQSIQKNYRLVVSRMEYSLGSKHPLRISLDRLRWLHALEDHIESTNGVPAASQIDALNRHNVPKRERRKLRPKKAKHFSITYGGPHSSWPRGANPLCVEHTSWRETWFTGCWMDSASCHLDAILLIASGFTQAIEPCIGGSMTMYMLAHVILWVVHPNLTIFDRTRYRDWPQNLKGINKPCVICFPYRPIISNLYFGPWPAHLL